MTPSDVICQAIRSHRLLHFDYDGLERVVAPYCHGTSRRGAEVLRAVQVGGSSRSGGMGFGKLWTVARMKGARMGDPFVPDDPDYHPDDTAMARIHCRI